MKLTRDQFEDLKNQWYEKLKQEGFKDIELISSHALPRRFVSMSKEDRALIYTTSSEFFHKLQNEINKPQTTFRNDVDKYILMQYASGVKITSIVKELAERGTPRYKEAVRFIIRRYEMAWNIRKYSEKQLGRKKRGSLN